MNKEKVINDFIKMRNSDYIFDYPSKKVTTVLYIKWEVSCQLEENRYDDKAFRHCSIACLQKILVNDEKLKV